MEREQKLREEREGLVRKHAMELKKQIAINEEKKQLDHKLYLEEGLKMKHLLKSNSSELEEIKREKLKELMRLGIP